MSLAENAARGGLFLDRDGTVIEHIPYLHDPAGVQLVPGAREVLAEAIGQGILLFLHTNQSGVGRGYYKLEDVHACNQRMFELLDLPKPGFSEVCIAPEPPHEPNGFRKPSPRFIRETIAQYNLSRDCCCMVGDMPTDLEAARNAGIEGILLDDKLRLPEAIRGFLKRIRG